MKIKTFEKCEVCGNAVDVTEHAQTVGRNVSGNFIWFMQFLTMTIWHAVLTFMVGGGFLLWFVWFIAQSVAWTHFFISFFRLNEKKEQKQ